MGHGESLKKKKNVVDGEGIRTHDPPKKHGPADDASCYEELMEVLVRLANLQKVKQDFAQN